MKIYILSDESYLGGASIVNHRIMEELKSRGHDVRLKAINPTKDEWNGDMSADYYIVANWGYINTKLLEDLFYAKGGQIMKFFHDIPGFMYQPKTVRFQSHYNLMQHMANNAVCVFISDLQKSVYSRFIEVKEHIVLPPPKNMENFKNEGKERNGKALYLGDISEARGISEAVQIAKQQSWDISFIGPFVDQTIVDNLKTAGFDVREAIQNEEVAKVMNEYTYFIYYPNLIDSFCLKILEAELCGMEIVADSYRIGRYYYNESLEEMKDLVSTSHIKIADIIEESINGTDN